MQTAIVDENIIILAFITLLPGATYTPPEGYTINDEVPDGVNLDDYWTGEDWQPANSANPSDGKKALIATMLLGVADANFEVRISALEV